MRGAALLALASMVGCGGGDGGSRSSTSPPPSVTTLPSTTTTTLTPEEAVRAAWVNYWAMVDRLLGAPDPTDPELGLRAVEPLLGSLRDDLATRAAEGRHVVVAAGSAYAHRLDRVVVSGESATVGGCDLDDSTTLGPNGEVVDDSQETRTIAGIFVLIDGAWRASDVRFTNIKAGISNCD